MFETLELAANATRFGLAVILLYSGSSKLAAPRDFRATLLSLGVPKPRTAAAAFSLFEIITAIIVALPRTQMLGAGLVVVLGLIFAGAGAQARARNATIACACFGQAKAGRLGVRQIVYLPVWLGAAFLVAQGTYQLGLQESLLVIALAALCMGLVKILQALPTIRENRIFVQASLHERER